MAAPDADRFRDPQGIPRSPAYGSARSGLAWLDAAAQAGCIQLAGTWHSLGASGAANCGISARSVTAVHCALMAS